MYLDDITIFSKKRGEHAFHLKQIFKRCRKYGISLNPKKCVFAVMEGKLLGHIVSKKGISIDPERIKAIEQIPLPHNKKGMQYFMGNINFVHRFVPDFAQTVKPMQQMVKQNAQFKWTDIEKDSFRKIKTVVAHAPSLRSPDFDKDFILYTFTSDDSLAAVLTQKEDRGDEFPISFMSTSLQGAELKYHVVDKQAYAFFKAIKQFKPYILKNRTKVIVPYPAVRSLLIQKELGERRGN